MALNQMGLGFLFTAKDLASGTMNRIRGNFGRLAGTTADQGAVMNKAFAGITAGLGLVGVGFGGLAAGFEAANAFGKFEQSLAAVKAVTKATPPEFKLLKDSAIQAGIATQFSPDEATQGLLSLATAGQTARQATQSLIPVLDLAAGSLGQLGVSESAEAVVGTLNAYGLAADKATGVTDQLLRVTQLTNFQTRDFSIGLSKAAAAGATFGQDLNDVLITMGLLRNRNIDASSSATAFREAVRRLGSDQRAQKAITEKGVDVFDQQTGKMRPLIDITQDFIEATQDLTDKERNRRVVQAFGARGLLAFNAIQKASFTTMKDGKEVTLQGTEAIAALRREMGKSEGTAAGFKDALLDTFEGQKTLLKGSLQTLAITSGEVFAKTFAPIVAVIIRGVNLLIKVITSTPEPIKKLVIGALGLISVFTTLGGGAVFVGASLALLLPVIKVVLVVLAGLALVLLPVIVAFGALAFVIYGLKRAGELGILPFSEDMKQAFEKVKLAVNALVMFFKEGKISGEIAKELTKAENQGVLNFVDRVVRLVQNLQNFFKGVGKGFDSGLKKAKPAIDAMKKAFDGLFMTLGKVFGGGVDPEKGSKNFEKFGSAGEKTGNALANTFAFLAKAITVGVKALNITILVIKKLAPLFAPIKNDLKGLGEAFKDIKGKIGPGDAKSQWSVFGALVTTMVMGIVVGIRTFLLALTIMGTIAGYVFGIVATGVAFLASVFKAGIMVISGIIEGDWGKAWQGMKLIAIAVIRAIVSSFNQMALAIAKTIDAIGRVVGKDFGATAKVRTTVESINTRLDKFAGTPPEEKPPVQKEKSQDQIAELNKKIEAFKGTGPSPTTFTAAATTATEGTGDLKTQLDQLSKAASDLSKQRPPVSANIKVELDGDVIKEKHVEATDTGFSPGGSPSGG